MGQQRRKIGPDDVATLVAALAAELPRFRIRYKDESRLQRAIAALLRPFNRRYLSDYTTVMFGAVYFPSRSWQRAVGPRDIWLILRHEAVHLRDARRWPLLFQLSYLFVLPAGVTLRAWWEWRAYAESVRATMEIDGVVEDAMLADIAERFVGSDYLWMWPSRAWIQSRLERLRGSLRG